MDKVKYSEEIVQEKYEYNKTDKGINNLNLFSSLNRTAVLNFRRLIKNSEIKKTTEEISVVDKRINKRRKNEINIIVEKLLRSEEDRYHQKQIKKKM